MESGRGRTARRALVPIALFAVLAAACAAPVGESPPVEAARQPSTPVSPPAVDPAPSFALPDITDRSIGRDDLVAMLPAGESTPMPRTNEDLVTLSVLDRDDEASDIVLFGRITGVGAAYDDPSGAYVWIDLLPDADAAADYLHDTARDIAKGVGGTHDPASGAGATTEFAVDVASDSIGIVAGLPDGTGEETLVLARAGRLVFFASIVHEPGVDARVRVQYLAEGTLDGIVEVLTEAEPEAPVVAAPRYRFETTTSVTDEGGTTVVTVAGLVDGDDRSCTFEFSGDDGTAHEEVVRIDGLIWWRTGDAGFARVGTGNAHVAALLSACPAWSVDVDAAGLTGLVAAQPSPARHHVNGVDASGYQSDADGLAAVLGRSALGATVDGFSFWVADEAPWVVELAISLTGPADERMLLTGPLARPVGSGALTIRHRVFDIGAVEESIVPPS